MRLNVIYLIVLIFVNAACGIIEENNVEYHKLLGVDGKVRVVSPNGTPIENTYVEIQINNLSHVGYTNNDGILNASIAMVISTPNKNEFPEKAYIYAEGIEDEFNSVSGAVDITYITKGFENNTHTYRGSFSVKATLKYIN